jgi:hypothetical protein
MGKKVTDLTAAELDALAAEAWFEASEAALKAGVPVVGTDPVTGKLVKTYPDGLTEILGDARLPKQVQAGSPDAAKSHKAKSRGARTNA